MESTKDGSGGYQGSQCYQFGFCLWTLRPTRAASSPRSVSQGEPDQRTCESHSPPPPPQTPSTGEYTRHTIDANITMQDLVDSYMRPFQVCVEQGKVSSLMCR